MISLQECRATARILAEVYCVHMMLVIPMVHMMVWLIQWLG